jgi:hypothetical protein
LVKAFISPPTASIASAIWRADRDDVPLNTRCSRKCEAPASAAGSSRPPTPTQTPSDTDRASGIRSVTMRMPLASRLWRISSVAAAGLMTWGGSRT